MPEQLLELALRVVSLPESHLDLGRLHLEERLPVLVLCQFGEVLKAGQGGGELALFEQRRRDLFLYARIVRELFFEAVPNFESLVRLLCPLIDTAQRLKDIELIGLSRLPLRRPLQCLRRLVRLSNEDQRLTEVVRREVARRVERLGLTKRLHGHRVLPAQRLHQTDDHPRSSRFGPLGLRSLLAIRLDDAIQRTPLDVIAVDLVERRPPPRVLFENRHEPVDDRLLFGLLGIDLLRMERERNGQAQRHTGHSQTTPPEGTK